MPFSYGSPKNNRRIKLKAFKQRPWAVICQMTQRNIGAYKKWYDYKRQMVFNLVCTPST